MPELTLMQKIAVWALPVLFAITLHEVAHGYVAHLLGDNTARAQGRLSVNPLRHIDPVGTILVPLLMVVLGTSMIFGWAKPVPVNVRALRHPRRDFALVSAAGPISNFLMAIFWGLVLKLGIAIMPSATSIGLPLYYMGFAGILINLVLAALNILPIPPLDGSRILAWLLPPHAAYWLDRIEPYGFFILLLLLVSQLLDPILYPVIKVLQTLLFGLIGSN